MLKLLFFSPLLASCMADPVKTAQCGESFCLPQNAVLLQKSQPVEDFNLYKVSYAGREFYIYEGNHPADIGQTKTVTLRNNRSAQVSTRSGRTYIREGLSEAEPWPRFLQISTTADPQSEKDLVNFLSNFSEKMPSKPEQR